MKENTYVATPQLFRLLKISSRHFRKKTPLFFNLVIFCNPLAMSLAPCSTATPHLKEIYSYMLDKIPTLLWLS